MLAEAAELGAKRALESITDLDMSITGFSENCVPEKEQLDVGSKIRKSVKLNGQTIRLNGATEQDIFDSFLAKAIEAGIVTGPGNITKSYTFREYAERWMTLYKKGKKRHTTLAGYNSYLNKHLYPHFGDMPIDSITIDEIQRWMNTKGDLAKKTIKEMLLVLGMVLGAAQENGLIKTNPAKSKILEFPNNRKTIREPLTTEQFKDIFLHLKDLSNIRDRRLVALLLFLPVRREEVLGFQMGDIDLRNESIRVERAVTFAGNKAVIGDPKTEAGFRSIPIMPILWEQLAITPEELEQKEMFIVHRTEDPFVPYTKQTMVRAWERISSQINVYGKTPHYFRHTFATIGNRVGVDKKTMQTIGGWADSKTLDSVYIHTQDEDIEYARRQLGAFDWKKMMPSMPLQVTSEPASKSNFSMSEP